VILWFSLCPRTLLVEIFEGGSGDGGTGREQGELVEQLYQEIDRLKMELDWLQKKGALLRPARNGR
jgi:hypothetical protein